MNNVEWHQRQVYLAKTIDDLEQAALDIDYDVYEKIEWTKERRQLARLGTLVEAKRIELNGLRVE